MKIETNAEQLGGLFPSYISIDDSLTITGAGPVVLSAFSENIIGNYIFDHFDVLSHKPAVSLQNRFFEISKISLLGRKNIIQLSGEVIKCCKGFILALRLDIKQILHENIGIQISDFEPDDPSVQGGLMFSLQRALLEEQQQVAIELAHERQNSLDLLERISRLAGFISHDFNNFLSIIRLNCDRLIRDDGLSPRALRLIDIIKETAARGSSITRSFMTLSHQRDDSHTPVNIDSLIEENMSFFSAVAGSSINLEYSLNCRDALVNTNKIAAVHCIVNLLMNARDATVGNGIIKIKTRVNTPELNNIIYRAAGSTTYIVIEVEDNGQGMDAATLSRAFEPLFSTKSSGTGLGLASVLDFVRDAGGDACIESIPGGGTRVHLYLPTMQTPAEKSNPHNATDDGLTTLARQRNPRSILLVDDEPYALEALAELFDMEGYRVEACPSFETAAAKLEAEYYDILITDIVMPGKSGILLAEIAQSTHMDIKIIVMSGYVPEGGQIKDDWIFVRKPFATSNIIEIVQNAISSGG